MYTCVHRCFCAVISLSNLVTKSSAHLTAAKHFTASCHSCHLQCHVICTVMSSASHLRVICTAMSSPTCNAMSSALPCHLASAMPFALSCYLRYCVMSHLHCHVISALPRHLHCRSVIRTAALRDTCELQSYMCHLPCTIDVPHQACMYMCHPACHACQSQGCMLHLQESGAYQVVHVE